MKRIFSILSLLLVAGILVACSGGTVSFDPEQGYITVGMEADYAPFNWYETSPNGYNHPIHGDEGGYVAGFDVEMARHIADELGLELRIRAIEWTALVPALQTGEIDLIIAGMSPTAERREVIGFTDAYYISNHVVVVLTDGEFADAETLEDLEGARGVGQIGTVYADLVDFVATNYGAVAQPVVDSITLATNAVIGGTADFTIVEKPVALGMIAAYPQLSIVLDVEENIFEVSDEDRELAVGHRQIDSALADLVNAALDTVTNEMRETWMVQAVSRSAE